MQALAFWKAVAMDQSNFLEDLIALLEEHRIRYLDLDLVVADSPI
jgi:hypothetical protein